jgi:hypothetical protein
MAETDSANCDPVSDWGALGGMFRVMSGTCVAAGVDSPARKYRVKKAAHASLMLLRRVGFR